MLPSIEFESEGQAWQINALTAAVAPENIPLGHISHGELPLVALNFPVSHALQACPTPEKPARQIQSSCESLPSRATVPFPQETQAEASFAPH